MQADAQGAFDELRAVVRSALCDERGQCPVRQPEAIDDDRLTFNADRQPLRWRWRDPECDYLGGFHGSIVSRPSDS